MSVNSTSIESQEKGLMILRELLKYPKEHLPKGLEIAIGRAENYGEIKESLKYICNTISRSIGQQKRFIGWSYKNGKWTDQRKHTKNYKKC